MEANTKTPVMVLQEYTVKKKLASPEYTIEYERQGTHDNEFQYRLTFADVVVFGTGRSKQIAKHEAAQKALDLLAEKGLYNPSGTIIKAPRIEPISDKVPVPQLTLNYIGRLQEVCFQNKIALPVYNELQDVGPPHMKSFTYQCQIGKISTVASAGQKKVARHTAAKEMLDKYLDELVQMKKNQCSCSGSEDAEGGKPKKLKMEADIAKDAEENGEVKKTQDEKNAHVECEIKSDDQVIKSKKPKLDDSSEAVNVEKKVTNGGEAPKVQDRKSGKMSAPVETEKPVNESIENATEDVKPKLDDSSEAVNVENKVTNGVEAPKVQDKKSGKMSAPVETEKPVNESLENATEDVKPKLDGSSEAVNVENKVTNGVEAPKVQDKKSGKMSAPVETEKPANESLENATEDVKPLITAMPELLLDTDIAPNSKALTDLDTEALSKYKEIKARIFKVSKPDLSLKVEDYPKHLLKHLEDKELTVKDVRPLLCGEKTEDNLKTLLAKMGLEYEIVPIVNSKEYMWNLLVNTNLKISTIGRGETDEIAQHKAIEFLFDYMKQLILGI